MTLSGQIYTCSAGETFDIVALAVYGDEKYASELYMANPELCAVTRFSGNETLLLPVVEVDSADAEEDGYMPAKAPWKE